MSPRLAATYTFEHPEHGGCTAQFGENEEGNLFLAVYPGDAEESIVSWEWPFPFTGLECDGPVAEIALKMWCAGVDLNDIEVLNFEETP